MGLSIDIAIEHAAWASVRDVEDLVARATQAALAEAAVQIADQTELSLVLCNDAFIRGLNRDWRGKDKATNVLSFPADPSARHATLGDIVVAYETSADEAAREHRRLDDHLAHLVVHGLLHLLGHDHARDADAEAMERLETRALERLGIASPHEDAAPLGALP